MVGEKVLNQSVGIANEIVEKLGQLGLWLQALGLVIVIWIIVQIANWVINRKRLKRLDVMIEKLDKIERELAKKPRAKR
ncbi:hypothetical protein D6817_04340 [Candidatus Pacearchaeota archaeon]|nr:MAG: hypothetical protein D6817_04340 [Candidatus Pacearchaeota archaeon]